MPIRSRWFHLFCLLLFCTAAPIAFAAQISVEGLLSVNGRGAFVSVAAASNGNLYALLNAGDGVRVYEFDATATHLLYQVQLGSAGDGGVALGLDPAGNVFVAGNSNATGSLQGTPGTSFPTRSGSSANVFVAKLSPALQLQWLSFLGSSDMAAASVSATGDAVFVTGSIFSASLPVTASAIQQTPLPASITNGFVESFGSATGQLRYATYLTGANGSTTPAAVVADATDHAYIAGSTTSTGYPTMRALVPEFVAAGTSTTSGFLSELTPTGDGFLFSTFIPGDGIDSVAIDSGSASLLLSGNIAPGLFPITVAQVPIAPLLEYQALVRMKLDGSAVMSSTLLAPGTQSALSSTAGGFTWVTGNVQYTAAVPLLPVGAAEDYGNAFALRVNGSAAVDQAARFGSLPIGNNAYASIPAALPAVAALSSAQAVVAGSLKPTMDGSLIGSERFELPMMNAPNAALPSTVRDAMPPASCSGSACSGGAGLLAEVNAGAQAPALALSTDGLPNLTLRNVGTTAASGLQITASGYTVASGCGSTLPAGGECDLLLSGAGPGSVAVSATNASTLSEALPASVTTGNPISVVPKELDFGIQTSGSQPTTRTLRLLNLSGVQQTVPVRLADVSAHGYTVAQTSTTCAPAGDGVSVVLGPGAGCTVTLTLTASADPTQDGPVASEWQVGSLDVPITGYSQAATLSVSTTALDFGQRIQEGPALPLYVFLSNSSDTAQAHTFVSSGDAAFTVTDECPQVLEPHTVCRLDVSYVPASVPSADVTTLALDGGIQVQVRGEMVAQALAGAASVNPNLSVSPGSVTFSQPVLATTVSQETQTVTLSNSGAQAFPLSLAVSGDFSYATTCPATLGGGASCSVVVSFTPSGSGARDGLLSVTAGGATPVYVSLGGTGIAIVPANATVLTFPDVPLNTPSVQWIHLTQPFGAITAAVQPTGSFGVTVVEDTGYGHGTPPASAFQSSASGTCYNCYVGVQFRPSAVATQQAMLSLSTTAGGHPQTIALSGNGVALNTVYATPSSYDFGAVPISSQSAPVFLNVTNGTATMVDLGAPQISGDYVLASIPTGAQPCGGSLASGATCTVAVIFAPTAASVRAGTLSIAYGTGSVQVAFTGVGGSAPGIALVPNALNFQNTPGSAATQQTLTLTNTGSAPVTIGTPLVTDPHFATAGTCGSLTPGARCSITVTFTPGSGTVSGSLSLPVTSSSSTRTYTVPLAGSYTTENEFLDIVPGEMQALQFGSVATSTAGPTRVLHVTNRSSEALAMTVQMPRQFGLVASTCAALAPAESCDLAVTYTPVTSGDTTGTVFVDGTPSNGTTTLNGLAYLEGYGHGAGQLQVSGNFGPNGVLSFGQVTSGSTSQQILTLTNPVTAPASQLVTVRRISSSFPFLSTTTCGASLAPGDSCTLTITYSPLNQIPSDSSAQDGSDTGTVLVESDAGNAPLTIRLAGTSIPVAVPNPNNAVPGMLLQPSQGSLTFPATAVGFGSAPQTLALVNMGGQTIHISGLLASRGFQATSDCASLAPGASCNVSVTFTPQKAAPVVGTLEIQSDSGVPLEFVSLFAMGTPSSVSVSPTAIGFGRVALGHTSRQAVTVANNGTTSVTLGAITTSGSFAIRTTDASTCAPGTVLAAGTTCSIDVTFTPAAPGTVQGLLSIGTSITALPLTVDLSGTGTAPQLVVTPASLDFGIVPTATSHALSVTLANVSLLPVSALTFSTSAGYTVTSTCGIADLQAGSSCSATVTATPTTVGTLTGTLTINSSDPASPLVVPLTATVVQGGGFVLTIDGGTSAGGTVHQGEPQTFTLGITSTGGFSGTVALTCNPQGIYADVFCSVLPASVTLSAGQAQTSTMTVNTLSGVASIRPYDPLARLRGLEGELCATVPLGLWLAVRRRGRVPAALLAVLFAVGMGGCGSDDGGVKYALPGTYVFHVTGASTNGFPSSRSVTATVVVTPK